jgi:hypothetical protein
LGLGPLEGAADRKFVQRVGSSTRVLFDSDAHRLPQAWQSCPPARAPAQTQSGPGWFHDDALRQAHRQGSSGACHFAPSMQAGRTPACNFGPSCCPGVNTSLPLPLPSVCAMSDQQASGSPFCVESSTGGYSSFAPHQSTAAFRPSPMAPAAPVYSGSAVPHAAPAMGGATPTSSNASYRFGFGSVPANGLGSATCRGSQPSFLSPMHRGPPSSRLSAVTNTPTGVTGMYSTRAVLLSPRNKRGEQQFRRTAKSSLLVRRRPR